jgi:DDE family transposase
MSKARKPGRLRPKAKSFQECLRNFLTPRAWKQAQNARGKQRKGIRWTTQPLVLTLLFMTWCCGDSQAERFETARAFCAACLPKRKRPGTSVQGFQKALAKVPTSALRALAGTIRQQLAAGLDILMDGFAVLGCDGSRLETPRTQELEQRLGQAGKEHAAPTMWVTALVLLRWGVLWGWRLGKGTASERDHLLRLLPILPARALVVADAGYNGYELCRAILHHGASYVIRMSSKVSLYTESMVAMERWRDGRVYYWPRAAERRQQAPLLARLIRVRGKGCGKKRSQDVWLLTNVLDERKLSSARAARYYRWRWENEGMFRTYKRTLAKVKLTSRTLRLAHREAEGALLATQLLLAQGALALPRREDPTPAEACSPRKVLIEIRREIYSHIGPRQRQRFDQRLQRTARDQRQRRSSKVKRDWPRRGDHKPPKPPNILTLSP